jgi:nicotinamidase/pyrazinamidase
MSANLTRALILVDVQNDFCEGGSLAVAGGAEVARRISEHVLSHSDEYAAIVATADWHDNPGAHFAADPDYVDTWPPHCRIGTDGALFHPAAKAALEGFTTEGDTRVALADWLRDRAIEQVDVVGIATDHCVRATALDAAEEGFETTVLLNLTAGVARQTTDAALAAMREAEIELVGEPLVS